MEENKTEAVASKYTPVKLCPLDAEFLVRGSMDNIPGWICPVCEYFEPDA